ncbi:MAG: ISAs1 family transposase [Kineosporiaceae bacterium]
MAHDAREAGHGRREWRTLKVTAVGADGAGLGFPHAAQAIRLTRRRRHPSTHRWSTETVYAITSLTATQATGTDLAEIARGHWGIEDRLHWVRDVTFDEDRSQIRARNGPRLMATLRNLAIAILRLSGVTNIARALRYHARHSGRPLHAIMTC